MSVSCTHVVPVHEGNYPDAARKADEILDEMRALFGTKTVRAVSVHI